MRTPPDGLPRLLRPAQLGGIGREGASANAETPRSLLAEHLERHGPIPFRGRATRGEGMLIDSVERAGLTGRGGAGFPAARKMRAVLANGRAASGGRGRAVVVANGVESEPLSAKDRSLLATSPHLVLDGISLAAETVGAGEACLCVADEDGLLGRLRDAVAARGQDGCDATPIRVVGVPAGYVASEESALVHLLNGGPAVPLFVPPRPFAKGVKGRPTLVSNVETLAHIALIARYGPGWSRSVGTGTAAGSTLITVAGSVRAPGVLEIALGTAMRDVLALAGGPAEPPQAILAGGYFGGWLRAASALDLPVSGPDLRAAGASLGAGILAVLPESACGIAETARVARYLAGQSAGQCGPCVNGLPAIADALEHIASRGRDARPHRWLVELFGLVEGRGACHFPNAVVRLVETTLRVFSRDLREHLRRGPCVRVGRRGVLPAPGLGPRHGERVSGARR